MSHSFPFYTPEPTSVSTLHVLRFLKTMEIYCLAEERSCIVNQTEVLNAKTPPVILKKLLKRIMAMMVIYNNLLHWTKFV